MDFGSLRCGYADAIREAEKSYRDFWQACGLDVGDFERVFETTLAHNDCDAFSVPVVLEDPELEISKLLGKPCLYVRMAVDAYRADPKAPFPMYAIVAGSADPVHSDPSGLQSDAECVESDVDDTFSDSGQPDALTNTRKRIQKSTAIAEVVVKPVASKKPNATGQALAHLCGIAIKYFIKTVGYDFQAV